MAKKAGKDKFTKKMDTAAKKASSSKTTVKVTPKAPAELSNKRDIYKSGVKGQFTSKSSKGSATTELPTKKKDLGKTAKKAAAKVSSSGTSSAKPKTPVKRVVVSRGRGGAGAGGMFGVKNR